MRVRQKRNIQFKIIFVSVLSVIFAVLCISLSAVLYNAHQTQEQIFRDGKNHLEVLMQQTTTILDQVKQYSLTVSASEDIQQALLHNEHLENKDYNYYVNLQDVFSTTTRYTIVRDDILESISVIDAQNNLYRTDGLYNSMQEERWFKDLKNESVFSGFSGLHMIQKSKNTPAQIKTISYTQKIFSTNTLQNDYIGQLVIHLKYDVLFSMFEESSTLIDNFVILNEKGQIIYQSYGIDPQILATLQDASREGNQFQQSGNQYIVSSSIKNPNWTFIGLISNEVIHKELQDMILLFSGVTLGCLGITLLISIKITQNMTAPLMELVRGMRKVSDGALKTKILVKSGDEIELAANVFNNMVDALNTYFNETILQEREKRNIEIKLLMAQINPHFIYNTLNTIIYLGRDIHAENIITVSRNLIRILQNTIKTDLNQATTINEEIRFIESYISILKFRYDDMVTLVWDIPSELSHCTLPQMLLYPLVENSIYHGILPKKVHGTVTISLRKTDDNLKIVIADDGIGIPAHQIDILSNQLKNKQMVLSTDHIGLLNVHNRVRLLFGTSYGLQVQSTFQEGTTVSLFIPYSSS